jgi:UDP-N-acetylglucosamine--N-acetylmuramyl-(pentapeptide) pyrophosphoryl-undecaprenol N-acetylglucosamine transferase
MTTVLVASTGGHLAQLAVLRHQLLAPDERLHWITFDTPQSRSLLAGQDVSFVGFTAPRDFRNVLKNALRARATLRSVGATRVISTGSAIALSFLPAAAMMRLRAEYIESAARSEGPSVTGRILAHVPGVALYTQYPGWASRRWSFRGSIFDVYSPGVAGYQQTPPALKRVVVSLGTLEYPFTRLVRRLVEILPPDVEVLWQTGGTDTSVYDFKAQGLMPERELRRAVEDADVLVAHAGCGAALLALNARMKPVLVPRRAMFGEHVDDHQAQIALELSGRDIAIYREVEALTLDDLRRAAASAVESRIQL